MDDLDGLYIHVLKNYLHSTLSKFFNSLPKGIHLQVPMAVTVSKVPRNMDNIPEHLCLKSLYDV